MTCEHRLITTLEQSKKKTLWHQFGPIACECRAVCMSLCVYCKLTQQYSLTSRHLAKILFMHVTYYIISLNIFSETELLGKNFDYLNAT